MQLSDAFKEAWDDEISFEQIMAIQGEIFRDVSRRRTLRFALGEVSFFIKIHSGVGWREIFKNLTQGKLPVLGARNECQAISKLEDLGVETMTLSGFGERGLNPATKQSFIITEELTNTVSLEEFCVDWAKHKPDLTFKIKLIEKVAFIARQLHENGVNHRDFYICHFLLDMKLYENGLLTLYLIDLHRAQIRSKTPERWLVKDLAGLYFSAMDIGLTQRDIFRFLKNYRRKSLRTIFGKEKIFWDKVRKKSEKLYASHIP